mgnify:CR=1 FL=1
MLTNLNSVLKKARKGGYAVGAFNINNLEIAQAIIDAAESLKAPVILQTSEGALNYAGMDYLAAIAHVAAHGASIPVVFHLDHGKNEVLVKTAIKSGFYTSVMYDGSAHNFKENIKKTKHMVKLAHTRKITVEAELGAIAGVEDLVKVKDRDAFFTNPAQAEIFVKETKCDALAISIGTAHGAFKKKAKGDIKLDLKRLEQISKRVSVPLVLHGASGIDDKWIKRLHKQCSILGDCKRLAGAKGVPMSEEKKAIKKGVAKINIDSDLRIAFTASVRETIINDKEVFDPRKIMGPARDLVSQVVKEKIKAFGSAGKA